MPLHSGTEIQKDISQKYCENADIEQTIHPEELKEMLYELRKSEERFKQVAENSGDWIWEIDQTGLYTYSSPIIEEILGYQPQEVVGKKYFYDFFAPEIREDFKKAAFEVFARKECFRGFINSNIHKDGRKVILETNGSPVIDNNGNLWGYRGVDRDITIKQKTEEELKNSEEHCKILLNSIIAGVVMIDAQTHIIVDCNKTAEQMIGLPKENIIGKMCHKFICPAEKGKCPISDLRQSVDMSERVLLKSGNCKIPILKTVVQISWQGDLYYIESFINISHQKKMEKALWAAEERFRTAAKLASDLIWELDINTMKLEWFGDIDGKLRYNFNEFPRTMQAWKNIIHPEDYDRVINQFEKHFKDGSPYDTEYRVKRKDGSFLNLTDCGTILFDEEGKPERMIGVCTDVTNRRNYEQQQAELFGQLERANEELKSFAYVVSHDLKAPLRGVKVLADWICNDYADKLDDEGKNQMKLLISRVDRMHNLIDGILQYTRIGRIKESVSKVDTGLIVKDIIDTISLTDNIRITIDNKMPVITCEETRIIQIFQNLISNAIKYMDKENGIIKISCIEENGFWKFCVEDNGPGIEEAYFEKIFQMFQTLSPRDKFESTGVGLTVVKKIVELYGGRVWVESEVGKGSAFFFTIPR